MDLASVVWKIDPSAVLHRLAEHGMAIQPENLEERKHAFHRSCWLNARTQALDYWETCRQRLIAPPSPRLLALRQRTGLSDVGIGRKRLLQGPGQFYGASDAKTTAQQLGSPAVVRDQHISRFFGGRGWRDILVIPHWGSPSHILGFEFVGRLGQPISTLYRAVTPGLTKSPNSWGGIAGLLPVLRETENLVIITPDVLAMCCLQTRHYRHAMRPLPLVAWNHKRPPDSRNWANLNQRNAIFWDFALTAETVVCCAQHDAYLVIAGPEQLSQSHIARYLRSVPALDLIRQLEQNARPWRVAIRNWIHRPGNSQVQQLIERLESLDIAVAKEVKACLPQRQQPSEHLRVRHASIGLAQVIERNCRWFRESRQNRRGEPLFDGVVRIHRVILHEPPDPPEYLGEILKPVVGETHPIRIPFHLDEPQMDVFHVWAKKAIWEHTGEQITPRSPKEWFKAPLKDVALAFQTPKIEQGRKFFGWDGQGFQLRRYRIENGQFTSTDPLLLPQQWPAPDEPMPKASKQFDQAIGIDIPEMRYLWAIGEQAVKSLQAIAEGLPTNKVVLPAQRATAAITGLLRRLGLPCHPKVKEGLTTIQWQHRWPVVIAPNTQPGKWVDWFVETAFNPLFLVLFASHKSVQCPIVEGMVRIRRPPLLNMGQLTKTPIHKILPLYLRWWTNPKNQGSLRDWLLSRRIDISAYDEGQKLVEFE